MDAIATLIIFSLGLGGVSWLIVGVAILVEKIL